MRNAELKAIGLGTGGEKDEFRMMNELKTTSLSVHDSSVIGHRPSFLSLFLIAVSVFFTSSCAYDPHTHELDEMEVSLVTEPDPPKVGENVVRAKITDKKGARLADVHVTEFAYFRFEEGKQQGFLKASPAEAHGGNEYVGTVSFSEPGQWKIVLALERGGSRIDPVTFTFEVK